MRKFTSQLIAWLPTIFFLLPFLVRADLPRGNAVTLDDVDNIIHVLADFLIIMSMVVAVACIVLSGIMVMLAQADPTKFKNGIARLKSAIYGAAIVLGTGVILNTVFALVNRTFFCQISVLGICLY